MTTDPPPPPHADAAPGQRRRQPTRATAALLIVGVVAAGATAAALAGGDHGDASVALTPTAAVEAFFLTAELGDYTAHWELMCRQEQRDLMPREQYVEALAATFAPDSRAERFQVDVRGARSAGTAPGDGFAVEVVYSDSEGPVYADDVLVVWEGGGFRVCGPT
jgi:hypothetical protein